MSTSILSLALFPLLPTFFPTIQGSDSLVLSAGAPVQIKKLVLYHYGFHTSFRCVMTVADGTRGATAIQGLAEDVREMMREHRAAMERVERMEGRFYRTLESLFPPAGMGAILEGPPSCETGMPLGAQVGEADPTDSSGLAHLRATVAAVDPAAHVVDGRQVICGCGSLIRLGAPNTVRDFEEHLRRTDCFNRRFAPESVTSPGGRSLAPSDSVSMATSIRAASSGFAPRVLANSSSLTPLTGGSAMSWPSTPSTALSSRGTPESTPIRLRPRYTSSTPCPKGGEGEDFQTPRAS